MKNLKAAPGPYEVVTIIDEEGKARGRNGEKWLLIRNADGAIASVYPGQDAEATAKLLAASFAMLKACKLGQAMCQDEVDRLRSLESEGWNTEWEEATARLLTFDAAIAAAEGREPMTLMDAFSDGHKPPIVERTSPDEVTTIGEARKEALLPDAKLEDTLL